MKEESNFEHPTAFARLAVGFTTLIYSLLTALIILLSKVRSMVFKPYLRWDRTIPWPSFKKSGSIGFIACCDCGLIHFIIPAESITPVRPLTYSYPLRFGSVAYTKPDIDLGQVAHEEAKNFGYVES